MRELNVGAGRARSVLCLGLFLGLYCLRGTVDEFYQLKQLHAEASVHTAFFGQLLEPNDYVVCRSIRPRAFRNQSRPGFSELLILKNSYWTSFNVDGEAIVE